MQVAGKLVGQVTATAAVTKGQHGRLGMLLDEAKQQLFLIDTGSVYSILPHTSSEKPDNTSLIAADRSPIRCWGRRSRTLRAGGRVFKWTFILADVAFPIIRADFLVISKSVWISTPANFCQRDSRPYSWPTWRLDSVSRRWG